MAMVDRFCFVKLKDRYVAQRADLARQLSAALDAACAAAPDIGAFTLGTPADDSAAKWDLAVTVRAESLQAWQEFIAMPAAVAIFDVRLNQLAEVIKAWTFEVAA